MMYKLLHKNKFYLSGIYAQEYNCWVVRPFLVFKGTINYFPFIFPPAIYEWFSFSTFLSAFGIIAIFNFSHFNMYSGISHCGLNVHVSNGLWCWIFLHVLICHFYILFSDVFIFIICPLSNWIFKMLCFKSCLYILHLSPLPDMWFANIFSPPVICPFIFLTWCFTVQKFLIWTSSNLLILLLWIHFW